MADTVRVQFSAQIGALIKGVEDAKSAIESVKASTDRVTEGAKSLLEAFGVGFSVDKLIEFTGQMAELGEQVERTSAMLGTSTKETQELGFIAKATGGSEESLALSMERLQVNLQKAATGAGPAAAALQALGLRAKDLIGLSLTEQMNRIADAMSKFADGGNKTAIAIELFGRSGAQLIPVLDQGRAGLDAMRSSFDRVGAMTPQTVEALSQLDRSSVSLKAALIGLGGTIVGTVAPALASFESGLTKLLGDVNVAIQTHTAWEREMIALSAGARELGQALLNMGTIAKDVFTLNWGAIAADREAGFAKIEAIQREADDRIKQIAKDAQTDLQKILTGGGGSDKPNAPPLNLSAGSATKGALQGYQDAIKADEEYYRQAVAHLDALAKIGQISEHEKTAALLGEIDKREQAELHWAEHELALGNLSLQQRKQIEDRITQIHQKAAADREKVTDQEMQKQYQEISGILSKVQNAWDGQLKQLLAGTESFGAAMKNIFADFALEAIKSIESVIVKQLALLTLEVLTGTVGSGGGGAFGGGTTSIAGITLPKFDVGTDYIASAGLAHVGVGEAIVPAQGTGPYTGGGTNLTMNVSALDGANVLAFIQRNGRLIANALQPHLNQPSYNNA